MALSSADSAAIAALSAELRAKNAIRSWDDDALVDALMARTPGPAEARRLLGAKMKRFEQERAGGRNREFRYLQDEFDTWCRLLVDEDTAIVDAACQFKPLRAIALPAMLHHAVVDAAPSVLYVGLWDGSVRCYDLASGTQRWTTPVAGACRLALSGDALYAGGTRGDVHRLDAASGKLVWVRNLAELIRASGR